AAAHHRPGLRRLLPLHDRGRAGRLHDDGGGGEGCGPRGGAAREPRPLPHLRLPGRAPAARGAGRGGAGNRPSSTHRRARRLASPRGGRPPHVGTATRGGGRAHATGHGGTLAGSRRAGAWGEPPQRAWCVASVMTSPEPICSGRRMTVLTST